MEVKQVIVVRKDLNMKKGKIGAQCAHASMAVLLDMTTIGNSSKTFSGKNIYERTLHYVEDSPLHYWLENSFTKICLYVNSEEELLEIYNKANKEGLPCSLIKDSGKTEFNGVPTYTCCAIGPYLSSEIDKITGNLSLL